MATTASMVKNLILMKIGDNEGKGPLSQIVSGANRNIDVLWDMYADKALVANGARLQYQYTLREALDMVLGLIATGDFWEIGIQVRALDEKRIAFEHLRDAADAEIKTLESKAKAVRPPATGLLRQTAPIEPDDLTSTQYAPNPNDRRYRGDPLLPPYYRGRR